MIPDEQLAVYFSRCMMFGAVGMFIADSVTEAVSWPWPADVLVFFATGMIEVAMANVAAELINEKHFYAIRRKSHR